MFETVFFRLLPFLSQACMVLRSARNKSREKNELDSDLLVVTRGLCTVLRKRYLWNDVSCGIQGWRELGSQRSGQWLTQGSDRSDQGHSRPLTHPSIKVRSVDDASGQSRSDPGHEGHDSEFSNPMLKLIHLVFLNSGRGFRVFTTSHPHSSSLYCKYI